MTASVVATWVDATVAALTPLADPEHAKNQRAYMKDVAPFLGMYTEDRRAAQRAAWKPLPRLEVADVATLATRLWDLPEREYQYAACDLLFSRRRDLPPAFVRRPIQRFVTTKPWWDTVDALGATITPLVRRDPALVELMWTWLRSDDRWLTRAAIGHQRGLRTQTDVPLLFAMCDEVAGDREFFVAKAVGWALRDVTAWDPASVQRFVDAHPDLPTVARREAERGLARAGTTPAAGGGAAIG